MLFFSPLKKFINSIKKIYLEIFIPNRRIRRVLKGDVAKNYLKPYVKKVVKLNPNKNSKIRDIENYTIWQFWDKGIENAPEIVKSCVASIDKFEPNKKHIILNMETIKDYVDIPQKYYDLLKSGRMKMAHFSDILRTYLLIEHGGCWIDATVLLTDKLPEYITNSDLFLFQNYQKSDLDGLNIASYFIHSKPNNKILKDVRDVIKFYWEDNNYLMNYFLYLHAFTMMTNATEENKEIWNKLPFVSFVPVQHFQEELLKKYDKKRFNCYKSCSSVHKLSFKSDVLGLKNTTDIKDTYYEKLIKNEL